MKILAALCVAASMSAFAATGASAFTVNNNSSTDVLGLYFGQFPRSNPTDNVGYNYLGDANPLYSSYTVDLRGSLFDDNCGVYDMVVDPADGPMVVLYEVNTCEDSFDLTNADFSGD